jgi:hypothetical protein
VPAFVLLPGHAALQCPQGSTLGCTRHAVAASTAGDTVLQRLEAVSAHCMTKPLRVARRAGLAVE